MVKQGIEPGQVVRLKFIAVYSQGLGGTYYQCSADNIPVTLACRDDGTMACINIYLAND